MYSYCISTNGKIAKKFLGNIVYMLAIHFFPKIIEKIVYVRRE